MAILPQALGHSTRDPTVRATEHSDEAFNFKLGATLKMEQKVLDILDSSMIHAQDEEVRELLRAHRAESEQHVATVEEAFVSLGWEVDDSPARQSRDSRKRTRRRSKRPMPPSSTP